jgi:hypothetical protein
LSGRATFSFAERNTSRVRRALVVLLVVLISCSDGNSDEACPASIAPERIVASPLEVRDLSVTVPKGTLDMNGDGTADDVRVENGEVRVDELVLTTAEPAGLSIRTWADVDGDGDDDLLVDDGRLWLVDGGRSSGRHDVHDIGRSVPNELTSIWPGDLDGHPGGDFYAVVTEASGTYTLVYDVLRNADSVSERLAGAPRALARLEKGGHLETVLLDPGPPSTITFSNRGRPKLRADLGESHRVTWVRVFDEEGTRKIALQVDRRVAVWPVPKPCR